MELFALKFRMRALFGRRAVEPFDLLEQAVREFKAAASVRYETGYRSSSVETKTRKSFETAIWGYPQEEDTIAPLFRKAIPAMEDICVPIVRARTTLWEKYRLF